MCRFIDTICFQNGQYHNVSLHQARADRTFSHFFPGKKTIDIGQQLPHLPGKHKWKVRLVYSQEVEEITSYVYEARNIDKLVLVEGDDIDYSFKYQNRKAINSLSSQMSAREDIIIIKDGRVTDASYANLALYDGQRWHTPSTPLLNGIKRQLLIHQGEILESEIKIEDLPRFQKVSLINALLDLEELTIDISNVRQWK